MGEETSSLLADLEAERTVLGAVLVDPSTLPSAEGSLRVEYFHDQRHQSVFRALVALSESGGAVDLVTLRTHLVAQDELETAGGISYIAGLVEGVPRISNVDDWCRIVRDKARRRQAINLARRLEAEARSGGATTDELLDRHAAAVSRLLESGETSVWEMPESTKAGLAKIDQFTAAKNGLTGIPTGIVELDQMTQGAQRGASWYIAARTGRGKSVMCSQIAVHAADLGYNVLIFCMEMPPPDIAERMIFADSGVDRWDLRRADRDDSMARVMKAASRLSKLPILMDPRESPTLAQVRATAKQLHARRRVDLVIIDYLQRMTVDPRQDRWVSVGDLAHGLKSLAQQLNVPVIAASQLNAEGEEKEPNISNLAQAQGGIGANADLIAFLHPENVAEWNEKRSDNVNLIVRKHRRGDTGTIPLVFRRNKVRFESRAAQAEEWNP